MTNQQVREVYLKALRMLSLLNSEAGQPLREKNTKLVELLQKTVNEYRMAYITEAGKGIPELEGALQEIQEITQALPLISTTDYESIKELDQLLTESTKRAQSLLLYDPQLFYDSYFLNVISDSTQSLTQYITKNERFQLWFSGSKVVDDQGEPLLVYHGTGSGNREFNEFKFSPFPAAYFAENKSYSEWFAKVQPGKETLFKCYLRVLNPIDLTLFGIDEISYHDFITFIELTYGYKLPESKMVKSMAEQLGGKMWAWRYLRAGTDWLRYIAQRNEFDGFHYYENNPDDQVNGKENVTKAWIVFHGNQIKSADTRNNFFSLESNNITMEKGGTV